MKELKENNYKWVRKIAALYFLKGEMKIYSLCNVQGPKQL